ncbi:hypothetical protein DCO59_08805 [Helicobacter saguini]|uniref:hypothetical protein n=1 Tax=Helicobacter saguini TaxID=1548018 RepID=UPI00136C67A6|nr:hypothetical protein [Helicobacter saguini]MWV72438.1 hypothetical protein [Helicobacter saguini]
MILQEILKDSHYKLDLFDEDSINNLESRIFIKETKHTNGGGGKALKITSNFRIYNILRI